MSVTIKQISEISGVSRGTVDRVPFFVRDRQGLDDPAVGEDGRADRAVVEDVALYRLAGTGDAEGLFGDGCHEHTSCMQTGSCARAQYIHTTCLRSFSSVHRL